MKGYSLKNREAMRRAAKNPRSRRKYNLLILWELLKLVLKNPEQRFGQIMRNYGVVRHTRPAKQEVCDERRIEWQDEFYFESETLLDRIRNLR